MLFKYERNKMNYSSAFYILTLAASICCSLAGMELKTPTEQTSTLLTHEEKKELMDKNIVEVLDTMFNRHAHGYYLPRVCQKPWLPGHRIKTEEYDGSRIKGAQLLINSIKKRVCNDLLVVNEMQYSIPEKFQQELNYYVPSTLVISQNVEGKHNQPINLRLAEQLKKVNEDTYIWDFHPVNLIHTPKGKICFIDTEMRGFETRPTGQGLRILLDNSLLDDDATRYIKSELERYQEK